MKTVNQLLQTKGHDIWDIHPEASVYEALKLMADKKIGSLVVLEDGKLVGIISERDYARKVILLGKSSSETSVKDIMSRELFCVHPDQSIEECMAIMTNRRVRHLPVLLDEQLAGMISIGDVVKAIISDQEFIIEQLENYIVTSST